MDKLLLAYICVEKPIDEDNVSRVCTLANSQIWPCDETTLECRVKTPDAHLPGCMLWLSFELLEPTRPGEWGVVASFDSTTFTPASHSKQCRVTRRGTDDKIKY